MTFVPAAIVTVVLGLGLWWLNAWSLDVLGAYTFCAFFAWCIVLGICGIGSAFL